VKPLVLFPDPELAAVALLEARLGDYTARPEAEGVHVGVALPSRWTAADGPYVQVACDGSVPAYPVYRRATVRVTVWHSTTTKAKALAELAYAVLLAHPGGGEIRNVLDGTGVLPTYDRDTKTDLATFTVRVTLRPTPLP
jgi:hypothetical protein